MSRYPLLLVAAALLSGCASLSKSQCRAGDWETIGYSDGVQGRAQAQLLKHQNACGKVGVVPDRQVYLAGWRSGVAVYCEPQNGFRQGERGARYADVCPSHLEPAFADAYHEGYQLYRARSEIDQLIGRKNAQSQRAVDLEKRIDALEERVVNGELTPSERRQALDETKRLSAEQGRIDEEIDQLIAEIAVRQDRLAALEVSLAYGR